MEKRKEPNADEISMNREFVIERIDRFLSYRWKEFSIIIYSGLVETRKEVGEKAVRPTINFMRTRSRSGIPDASEPDISRNRSRYPL